MGKKSRAVPGRRPILQLSPPGPRSSTPGRDPDPDPDPEPDATAAAPSQPAPAAAAAATTAPAVTATAAPDDSASEDEQEVVVEVPRVVQNPPKPDMSTRPTAVKATDKMSAKRKSYSVEYKKGIVEASRGKNLTAFCKEKQLDLRMVRKWRSDYAHLRQQVDQGNAQKRKCGSGRQALFPELEDLVCEWIADRGARALVVRRADIQAFALAMAPRLEISPDEFKASQHWLDGFLQRYHLICL